MGSNLNTPQVSSKGATWEALTGSDGTDDNTFTLTSSEVGKQVRYCSLS